MKLNIKDSIIYARPGGSHYHTDRNCPMLRGDVYRELRYTVISYDDVAKRNLKPCECVNLI